MAGRRRRPGRGILGQAPREEGQRDGERRRLPRVVRAFLTGSILELLVNDQYALTRRAYDLPAGGLAFRIDAGEVEIGELTVKSAE